MNDSGFYSIDRLVEFGLGMAVAQQMVQTMNQAMQQVYVPGSIQSMPAPQQQPCYVAIDGESVGPLSERDLVRLITEKKVTKETLAWMPGMPQWRPIEQLPSILRVIALTPPPIPQSNE